MTISDLMADQLIATDAGTHSGPERHEVYEKLDGTRYAVRSFAGATTGTVSVESVKDQVRWLSGVLSPKARREQIAHLRTVDVEAAKSGERLAHHREKLLQGWDGYRFVGIEEGRRLAGA